MKAKKMDIQLKQTEIEKAVRNYVADKIGINLLGKRLSIQFSMTRGAGGLVTNLAIEDASDVEVPGFTDRDADTVKGADIHTLPVTGVSMPVSDTTVTQSPASDDAALTETSVPVEKFDAAPAPADAAVGSGTETEAAGNEPKEETKVDPDAPKSVGSLFS